MPTCPALGSGTRTAQPGGKPAMRMGVAMSEISSGTAQTGRQPPVVLSITTGDIVECLGKGVRDFQSAPQFGIFFGAFYAAGGWVLAYLFYALEINYYVYPMATGFAMVAPFVAAGLYEVSRRLECGDTLSWGPVLTSLRTAGGKDLGWMVLTTTFAYIIWLDIAIALYVIFFGLNPVSLYGLLEAIVTTPMGALFFVIGNSVGLVLAVTVFSITVVSFPLLFDRDVDFVTAMITSVKAVLENRKPMFIWCAIIGLCFAVSILSVFVGLIVALPILGHATWHLYRRTIAPAATGNAAST